MSDNPNTAAGQTNPTPKNATRDWNQHFKKQEEFDEIKKLREQIRINAEAIWKPIVFIVSDTFEDGQYKVQVFLESTKQDLPLYEVANIVALEAWKEADRIFADKDNWKDIRAHIQDKLWEKPAADNN